MGRHKLSEFAALKALSHLVKTWLLVLAALPFLHGHIAGPASAQDFDFAAQTRTFTIGVVSRDGATRTLEAWRPTADYLNDEAAFADLPYRFAVQPHTLDTLTRAIGTGEVDFALTNPAHFVATEVENGARAVLSLAHMWQGQTFNQLGAVVFTRSDSPARTLAQLEGASMMAVSRSDFSGWWLAEQEFRKRRLEPASMFSELVFSGGNQREVIYAVQSGLVDAGVIRAGVLEKLADDGTIDLSNFSVVSPNRNVLNYPFMLSTPLFPEWVLSAMPSVDEEVLALVINSLLNIQPESTPSQSAGSAVWQAPQNYQTVHDLLISLRVRPYENYLMQAAGRIYSTYRWSILGIAAFIVFSLIFLALQLRRNIMLAEERKNVLKSEIRSKVFYRSAVEEHTVFCMLRTNGKITHVNESFCETTDRNRDDLLGTHLSDILPDYEQEILQDEIMEAMKVGVSWDGPLKITKADGSLAWAQCTVIPVSGADEKLSEIALVATDMTETRKGISDESFHDSLELIEDQVIVFRPGPADILYCNAAADRLLIEGRIGGTWEGKKVKDIISDEDFRTLEMRCQSLQEGPVRRMTWEVTAQNGTPYEISLEYVQPENDEPRFISMYRDITQRKVAEKAKNEFVATVSHELRTPLTSMKGALGLAMSGAIGEMPEQMNKMISMASTNCDKLVVLINDMLDVEKMESGNMEFKKGKIDFAEMVDRALETNKLEAEKFGVTLRLNIVEDEDGHFVQGDEDRLPRVLNNLLSNASKFSENGSEVIVSVYIHRGRVRLSVRDFGIGIPKAAQPIVFDKFTQANMGDTRTQQGTGLGLSVAKLIVDGHEGKIFFASEEGIGSEFFVDLPRIVGEEVIPLDLADEEDHPRFTSMGMAVSEFDEGFGDEEDGGSSGLQYLLAQLRSRGFDEVDIERSGVNVSQVVSGKGVVGQSTVFNWLSEDGRSLVAELVDRKKLGNLKVSVIQSKTADARLAETVVLNGVKANLYANWLEHVPGLSADGEAFKFMAIGREGLPSLDDVSADIMPAENVSQALVLCDTQEFDALLHFDQVGLSKCMTIIPVKGGRMPSSMPVILLVTQIEAPEAERGVVSKFARPAAGGRGRGRRRGRG